MAARVIVYKSRMTKTMRRTKILCPPLFLFLEENDKSEPVANRHYKVRIIIIWYSRRESNPELPLRRGLLYPFNYGSAEPYNNTTYARKNQLISRVFDKTIRFQSPRSVPTFNISNVCRSRRRHFLL